MTGQGRTVDEPIRDDEDETLVPCHACHGRKFVERERADGATIRRACRECFDPYKREATGRVLPEPIVFDLSHLLVREDSP